MDNNGLREQVMINQFVLAAGCSRDQAAAILTQASWQFQTALSIYFQEAAIPRNGAGFSLITPANTPATPPNFPDALTMFSNLSTSDKMATSPLATSSFSPRNNQQPFFRNSFSPNPPMMSPPTSFFHEDKANGKQLHQQSSGFIQQQPWRGQQQQTQGGTGPPNCDQFQQAPQQAQGDASEANFFNNGNGRCSQLDF